MKKGLNFTEKEKKAIKYTATAIVLGVGGYYIYKGLKNLFTSETEQSLEDYKKEQERLQKVMQPTRSFGQWKMVADSIYNSIKFSSIADNKDNAERQLKMVQNDLDLNMLIEAYGKRQLYFYGIPDGNKTTLVGAIATGELSDKRIDSINKDYAKKGIKFRF
jgi:hypothetical protein